MRIWDDKSFIPFRLEALTPVHIGSGEDFSPLGYVVRQVGEADYEAWLIDTTAWLAENRQDPELDKALEAGDMASLRGLLNRAHLEYFTLAKIPILSPLLGKELMQKRNSVENSAEIMSFMRNPFTHMPYVPASSIKGAITTALTDFLNEKRKGKKQTLRDAGSNYANILKEMFGSIGEHAMRALRMADISLPPGATSIRMPVGVNLAPGRTLPKTPCETLDPAHSDIVDAYGNMRITAGNAQLAFPDGSRISIKELGKICTNFYKSRFMAEWEKFYTKPHLAETAKWLANIEKRIQKCDGEQQILLRIGHYSHIECVTVSGVRHPKSKAAGTSRTLADQKMPFGWVILSPCSLDDYNQGISELDRLLQQKLTEHNVSLEIFCEKQKEEELRISKEKDEAKKREMELAAMSPHERAIWELDHPTATENMATDVFRNLADFGELQIKAAEALMRFWQRIDKWEGKQLTKKQKEKVAAVKSILHI